MIEEIKSYRTSDGEIFSDKHNAEMHEQNLQNIKVYRIDYHPDLNEGYSYYDRGFVFIHANRYHEKFLKNWLYENLGNPISFIMGVFGSNAIMDSYIYYECNMSEVDENKILAKIEEKFVDKIWT